MCLVKAEKIERIVLAVCIFRAEMHIYVVFLAGCDDIQKDGVREKFRYIGAPYI